MSPGAGGEAAGRPMRRREFLVTDPGELEALCRRVAWGTLAFVDGEGWPVALPMSHGLVMGDLPGANLLGAGDGRLATLVFHGASKGRKAEVWAGGCRASYSVVEPLAYLATDWDRDHGGADPCSASQFFRSLEARGWLEPCTDPVAKGRWLEALVAHQEGVASTGYTHKGPWPEAMLRATALWTLRVEAWSGKFKMGQNLGDDEALRLAAFLDARGAAADRETAGILRSRLAPGDQG